MIITVQCILTVDLLDNIAEMMEGILALETSLESSENCKKYLHEQNISFNTVDCTINKIILLPLLHIAKSHQWVYCNNRLALVCLNSVNNKEQGIIREEWHTIQWDTVGLGFNSMDHFHKCWYICYFFVFMLINGSQKRIIISKT